VLATRLLAPALGLLLDLGLPPVELGVLPPDLLGVPLLLFACRLGILGAALRGLLGL